MKQRLLAAILYLVATNVAFSATITATIDINPESNGQSVTAVWASMGNADTGTAVDYNHFLDRSIQVTGTFGGATVTVQGSNDGTNFATLSDYQGNLLTLTAAGLKPIAEGVRYIRVITSGGSGTVVTVTLFAER